MSAQDELINALAKTMRLLMVAEHSDPGNPANERCVICRQMVKNGALVERLTGKRL